LQIHGKISAFHRPIYHGQKAIGNKTYFCQT